MSILDQELPIRVPASKGILLFIVLVLLPVGGVFVALAFTEHIAFSLFALFMFALVGLAVRTLLSDHAYLQFDAEGFSSSRPRIFSGGAKVQRWLWQDCRDFRLARINHNLHLLFNHGPSADTKTAKINRRMFGRDQALIIQHKIAEQELMALVQRLGVAERNQMRRP